MENQTIYLVQVRLSECEADEPYAFTTSAARDAFINSRGFLAPFAKHYQIRDDGDDILVDGDRLLLDEYDVEVRSFS